MGLVVHLHTTSHMISHDLDLAGAEQVVDVFFLGDGKDGILAVRVWGGLEVRELIIIIQWNL